MRVPAVCDKCGTIFPSAIEVGNVNITSFSSCKSGPCPICGSTGHIPDGMYSFIDNTITLLKGSKKTKSELQRLIEILKKAKSKGSSIDEISKRISTEAPELSSIKDILPKTRSDLYAFLTIFITILGLYINHTKAKPDIKIEVNQVFNYIYQQQIIDSSASSKLNFSTKNENNTNLFVEKKIGRNDSCPCGSGKKYKFCHGK